MDTLLKMATRMTFRITHLAKKDRWIKQELLICSWRFLNVVSNNDVAPNNHYQASYVILRLIYSSGYIVRSILLKEITYSHTHKYKHGYTQMFEILLPTKAQFD